MWGGTYMLGPGSQPGGRRGGMGQEMHAAELAQVLWCRCRCRSGPHPPSSPQLVDAPTVLHMELISTCSHLGQPTTCIAHACPLPTKGRGPSSGPGQHTQLPGGAAFHPLSHPQVAAHHAKWVEWMEGSWELKLEP